MNSLKRIFVWSAMFASIICSSANAADTYDLEVVDYLRMVAIDITYAEGSWQYNWVLANANHEPSMAAASSQKAECKTLTGGYRLRWFRGGRGFSRMTCDFTLGDILPQPSDIQGDIDWQATVEASSAITGQENTFFLAGSGDLSDARVYFARGGNPVTVVFVTKTGEQVTRSYVVRNTSSKRPYRMFRTDAPYSNSPVSLSGKYVKLIGDTSLVKDASTNTVSRGVYLSNGRLYAVGDVRGQFLLAYYDSGNYGRVIGVQVIEIADSTPRVVSAAVGEQVWPAADGWSRDGLVPTVTSSGSRSDGRGDYLYAYSAPSKYAPHGNAVFAIRPTTDENDGVDYTWCAAITWSAKDSQGVAWPFEHTQYSIYWGECQKLLVSELGEEVGQQPIMPSDWSYEIMPYQEPDGHIMEGVWMGPGLSLVKVIGKNADGYQDIAFLSIEAVSAADELAATNVVTVGCQVMPDDPSAAIVTNSTGRSPLGYVYDLRSAQIYDTEEYADPCADVVSGTSSSDYVDEISSLDWSSLGVDLDTLDFEAMMAQIEGWSSDQSKNTHSELFMLTLPEPGAKNSSVEVWWNTRVTAGSLVGTAYFPTLCANIIPQFPDPNTTEQIVLASAKGSSGHSVFREKIGDEWYEYVHTNAIIMANSLPHISTNFTVDASGKTVNWLPNSTHSFVQAGDSGYICWALRSDMKQHKDLPYPLVYLKGKVTGADGIVSNAVWTYYVMPTNAIYPKFEGDMLAGNQLPGPHPLDLMTDPWLPQTWWSDPADGSLSKIVAYRDRKGVVWARRDGDLDIHMYYRNQPSFDYVYLDDSGALQKWTSSVGAPVPWNCTLNPNEVTNTVQAGVWTWHAGWPINTPTMRIGCTLTKAMDGLAEVWGATSASVLWPEPVKIDVSKTSWTNNVIQLIDPTRNQTASLAAAIGTGAKQAKSRGTLLTELEFKTGPNGNAVERGGKWYFTGLPGSLSSRFYYDPDAAITNCIVLRGVLEDPSGGIRMLHMNVLNSAERSALKGLVADTNKLKTHWNAAIDSLAKDAVLPTGLSYSAGKKSACGKNTYHEIVSKYSPIDHYALISLGGNANAGEGDTNWVVWVENDASPTNGLGVSEGDVISMHVMRIAPAYYKGSCVTRTDSINLLSQLQDVIYTETFAGRADSYYFEWQSAKPQADGTAPAEGDWVTTAYSGRGQTRFTLGKQGTLADLQNTYYRVRYRALDQTCPSYPVMKYKFSDWTAGCLAEGWIQRVINSITPFTQRVTDLYDNPPETTITMLRQIGGPYRGDVALNMDNMKNVGILETYMTLLNKAESMSITMGNSSIDLTDINKQLMQLVDRLDDFYATLGNEAYSDAANPTIGCGSDDAQYCSGLFSFDNQVPTLLDEELSLLRGRGVIEDETTTNRTVTAYQSSPCYNRLLWNFTRGQTEGEVAYVLNYNIGATDSTGNITAEAAAEQYPQGHGDAWGHYLSGLKLWYRLLRNPSFSWSVSMGEMNVNDHPLNVDYFEEEKMMAAAEALGRTAERIVDLTARKVWRDRGSSVSAADAGYEDKVASRAFGYGEWANRGGVATFVNWMVGNSLLPAAGTNETDYTDTGLLKINRSTCSELADLANRHTLIQRKDDRLNSNLNPLGLSDDAVPFGLSPAAADGSESHFDQSLEAAKTALENANELLEKAGESTARLRELAAEERAAEETAETEEADFNRRLIAYYGYPYAGDIGVGKTYEQDYDGPDLYHWMYTDSADKDVINGSGDKTSIKVNYKLSSPNGTEKTLSYDISRSGLILKPSDVTGTRRAWGSLQYAMEEYVSAIKDYLAKVDSYKAAWESTRLSKSVLAQSLFKTISSVATQGIEWDCKKTYDAAVTKLSDAGGQVNRDTLLRIESDIVTVGIELLKGQNFVYGEATHTMPANPPTTATVVIKTDTLAATNAIINLEAITNNTAILLSGMASGNQTNYIYSQLASLKKDRVAASDNYTTAQDFSKSMAWIATIYETINSTLDKMIKIYEAQNAKATAVTTAYNAIAPAAEKIRTLKAEAEAILEEREAARLKRARSGAANRYSEMAHRIFRDEALETYAASFDIAQRYTYLAAKAYDYETGGQITAGSGSSSFLDEIIGARMPGEVTEDGEPMRWGGSGDAGLSDILARLEENWQVLKPRLGINNPQAEMTWFSLRSEAFRILPGADGLNSWRNTLETYKVANLKTLDVYRRLCQPIGSTTDEEEPALVIPLGTTIECAKNFFGYGLAGGDNQFSPTYYATKIAEAGVELVGYNLTASGGEANVFGKNPYVYLIPAGTDRMRAPTTGETIDFKVADQVLPVPNILGDGIDDSWSEVYVNLTGQTSGSVNVRKYPQFRANGESNASTLIGRSVWNTEWVLIIPASSLLGTDSGKATALDKFIWGTDASPGVTDIRIGFRTYSHWGN